MVLAIKHGEIPKWLKGPVLKTGRSVITCVGSNPTLSAMKAIPTFIKEDLHIYEKGL